MSKNQSHMRSNPRALPNRWSKSFLEDAICFLASSLSMTYSSLKSLLNFSMVVGSLNSTETLSLTDPSRMDSTGSCFFRTRGMPSLLGLCGLVLFGLVCVAVGVEMLSELFCDRSADLVIDEADRSYLTSPEILKQCPCLVPRCRALSEQTFTADTCAKPSARTPWISCAEICPTTTEQPSSGEGGNSARSEITQPAVHRES